MIKKYLSALFSKQSGEAKDEESNFSIVAKEDEQDIHADNLSETERPPTQTKNKADVLVFDTQKRIFVVKKRYYAVAVYNSENHKIISKKENGEQSTTEFQTVASGKCLPFSGNWYHAEQTDMGLYCLETGTFHLYNSKNNTIQTIQNKFHDKQQDIIPITGDWLGDGKKSIGVFNKTNSTFFIKTTVKEGAENKVFSFGSQDYECTPLVGDWNGDGKETIGLYLPKQGVFFLHNSLDECITADMSFYFGPQNSKYIPLVGDWNGDGKDTLGLYDPEQGLFFLHNKNEGADNVDYSFHFGAANKNLIPVVGDWKGKGKTGVGIYDPDNSVFYLTQTLAGGSAELEYLFSKTAMQQPFITSYIA